jgi:hypothetical protein
MDKCKKKLTLLVAAVCLVQLCLAQKAMLGLEAAPNISWVNSDSKSLEAKGGKTGFSYGLIADIKMAERYYFGTGLTVTYMGGKLNIPAAILDPGPISIPVSNVTFNYTMQYLQIPLSLKFRTKEIGNFSYWAQFGYANSFLLKARASIISDNAIINESKSNVNERPVNLNYDYRVAAYRGSMIIGLGMEYPIGGNSRISLGLRYDNGFFDVIRDKNMTATNHSLSLNLGVYF